MAQFASWDTFLEQLLQDTEGSEELQEHLYEDYVWMHANPININQADSTELQRLGFLTAQQIEGIHYYIYRNGAIRSVGELMLIPQLDYHSRQLLSYFATFGEAKGPEESVRDTWQRMLTQGRSEVMTRTDIPLFQRAGYAPRTQNELHSHPSRYYMGNALYHNLRYNYRYGTRLSWGISAEKDAGEPFLPRYRPDYLSGYMQLADVGALRNLVIGNYRLRFGQGLVMNSNFALGKEMLLQGLGRLSSPITPHRGTSESNYYTGIAATIGHRAWQLTAFASYRRTDATLDGVSIKTLKTDGYHRTPTELARRGNTLANLFGAHASYASHGLHLGATALLQSFNRNIAPSSLPYKRYYPQGNVFANTSIDYAYHHHRFSIAGETAIDMKGSMATLNMLRAKATDQLHFTLLQRHYTHDYWALEAKSFSSASEVRNERGIYLGTEWQPSSKLCITAYADVYHFPYLRYRVSEPSVGTDAATTWRYTPMEGHTLTLRYRYRMNERDYSEGYRESQGTLLDEHIHRLRLRWDGVVTSAFTCQATLEGCGVRGETFSTGYIGTIHGAYNHSRGAHSLSLGSGIALFRADYAARLYGYERGLLYGYNYQMYYGTGARGYLIVQYSHKENPRLTATGKVGTTYYTDRTTIGSGAELIDACHREDIQLQLRYVF